MPGENEKAKKRLVKQRNAIITNVKKEGRAGREAADRGEWDSVGVTVIKLGEYRAKVQQISNQILEQCEDSESEDTEIETASAFDSDVLDYISQLQYAHQQSARPKSSDAAPSAATSSGPAQSQVIVQTLAKRCKIELPKLEIENFSGDEKQWFEFWDIFKSTIHDNTHLEKVDKFKYLRHFVEGDALRLLKAYELTDANYDTAVEVMKQRFGQKKKAIKAHFLALHEMQQARSTPSSLYETYDSIEMHIRSLLALGVQEGEIETYTEIMLDKFPYFIGVDIRRQTAGQDLKLGTLRKLLSVELEARAASGSTGRQNQIHGTASRRGFNRNPEWQPENTENALVCSETRCNPANQSRVADRHCYVCRGEHYTEHCDTYPDIPSKKQVIGDRCNICLQRGHSTHRCESLKPCYHCKRVREHHRSICPERFGGEKQAAAPASSSLNPAPAEFVSLNTSAATANRAVLQTALAQVTGEKGQTCQVRVLFDTGSTQSYMKTDVSSKIRAKVVGQEAIQVAGFEDSERRKRTYDRVKLCMLGTDGQHIPLIVNCTQQISCPITKVALDSEQYPVLKQIQLAEPLVTKKSEAAEIDLLIGCDYYYDIVGEGRLQGPNGLTLLESKLGFITTGRLQDTTGRQDMAMLAIAETGHDERVEAAKSQFNSAVRENDSRDNLQKTKVSAAPGENLKAGPKFR